MKAFPLIALATLCLAFSPMPSASAATQVVASADFTKDTGGGWNFYGHKVVADGAAKLAVGAPGKYSGGIFIMDAPIKLPADETSALHVIVKMNGFGDSTGKPGTSCSGRFFIAPAPLPKFVDCYSLPNTISFIYEYDGANNKCAIELFQKLDAKDGYGDMLYQGTFDTAQFPMTLDLALTKTTYRMKFDKEVAPSTGARSGYLKLSTPMWAGDLRIGGRVVNHDDTHDSQMVIGKFDVTMVTP